MAMKASRARALLASTDAALPLASGEPWSVLQAMDDAADRLEGVRVHQMHALRDHRYLHGDHNGRLDHVSYFLSPVTRPAFHEGALDLPQFVLHLLEYLGIILRLLQEKIVLTQLLLALDQLSFQFCNLRGLIDLFPLEGLQQIVHVLPHLVFNLVPLELRDLQDYFLDGF